MSLLAKKLTKKFPKEPAGWIFKNSSDLKEKHLAISMFRVEERQVSLVIIIAIKVVCIMVVCLSDFKREPPMEKVVSGQLQLCHTFGMCHSIYTKSIVSLGAPSQGLSMMGHTSLATLLKISLFPEAPHWPGRDIPKAVLDPKVLSTIYPLFPPLFSQISPSLLQLPRPLILHKHLPE